MVDKHCITCGWNDRETGSGQMCRNKKQGYNTGFCEGKYWKPIPKVKKKKVK